MGQLGQRTKYERIEAALARPQLVAAVLAILALGLRIGWADWLGIPPAVMIIVESVLAVLLLVRVPFAVLYGDLSQREHQSQPPLGRKRRSRTRVLARWRSNAQHTIGSSVRVALRGLFPRKPVGGLIGWLMTPFRRAIHHCGGEAVIVLLAIIGFALMPVLADDPSLEVRRGITLTMAGAASMYVVELLRQVQRLRIPPLLLFVSTYGILILIGAILLASPQAYAGDGALPFVDALFMSASASSVTGLSTVDVGTQLSRTGQIVLLCLIQVGGLGIMTFAAFASIMIGAGMSVRDRVAVSEMLNYDMVGKVGRLVAWLLGITLIAEITGFCLMYGHFDGPDGKALVGTEQFFYTAFHSISAFCNAGLSLYPDGLSRYGAGKGMDLTIIMPMMILVILGGLGFTVIMELLRFRWWHLPVVRRMPMVGKRIRRHPLPRLSLQTKLVLSMTVILLLIGPIVFWILESGVIREGGVLQGLPVKDQVVTSTFQGMAAPRSSGFNTIDFSQIRQETQFFTILLMLVGASPGSTGGGLKTTAVAIMFLVLYSSFRRRPVEVFRRRISEDQVSKVVLTLVTALLITNLATFALLITEGDWLPTTPNSFERLTFEVVSAFATVGLSTGITDQFSDAGKVILTLCMYLGRIGPITLVLALGRKHSAKFEYPGESVMLG